MATGPAYGRVTKSTGTTGTQLTDAVRVVRSGRWTEREDRPARSCPATGAVDARDPDVGAQATGAKDGGDPDARTPGRCGPPRRIPAIDLSSTVPSRSGRR